MEKGRERVLDRRGEFIFFFSWNELGQGGDEEHREASLGVRRADGAGRRLGSLICDESMPFLR